MAVAEVFDEGGVGQVRARVRKLRCLVDLIGLRRSAQAGPTGRT
jgi:hypothetical protein